jgi:hypothetical protein
LDQTIAKLTPMLATYEMTPVAEGSDEVRGQPYASHPGDNLPGGGGRSLVRRAGGLRRETTVFEQRFQTSVFGQSIGLTFRVTATGAALTGTAEVDFLGSASWSFSS